jgi:hypothetical protein
MYSGECASCQANCIGYGRLGRLTLCADCKRLAPFVRTVRDETGAKVGARYVSQDELLDKLFDAGVRRARS